MAGKSCPVIGKGGWGVGCAVFGYGEGERDDGLPV